MNNIKKIIKEDKLTSFGVFILLFFGIPSFLTNPQEAASPQQIEFIRTATTVVALLLPLQYFLGDNGKDVN